MCQVLSPRTSLTSVFCRFPQAEHLRQSSALLARNGNRWILVAIITGMAPLVGLEAEGDLENELFLSKNGLKMAVF